MRLQLTVLRPLLTCVAVLCGLAFASTAAIGAPPDSEQVIKESERTGVLPPAESTKDARPPTPTVGGDSGGLVEQAGIGGVVSYARVGVVELGGSLSVDVATDYLRLSIAPSIGYFIMDNVQLSAIMGLSYAELGNTSQTLFSFLIEPSVHVPFNDAIFGFIGLGLGVAYADEPGAGFALKPRIGLNFLIGRSGILSPALYLEYTTTSALQTSQGTLLQVSFGYGLAMGYTVMW